MTEFLCRTRPADWWETGDGGNRLALLLCGVCPGRAECASGALREAGVIRAGVAYLDGGQPAGMCDCGYPINRRRDPRRTHTECQFCAIPKAKIAPRKKYWADRYQARKQQMNERKERGANGSREREAGLRPVVRPAGPAVPAAGLHGGRVDG